MSEEGVIIKAASKLLRELERLAEGEGARAAEGDERLLKLVPVKEAGETEIARIAGRAFTDKISELLEVLHAYKSGRVLKDWTVSMVESGKDSLVWKIRDKASRELYYIKLIKPQTVSRVKGAGKIAATETLGKASDAALKEYRVSEILAEDEKSGAVTGVASSIDKSGSYVFTRSVGKTLDHLHIWGDAAKRKLALEQVAKIFRKAHTEHNIFLADAHCGNFAMSKDVVRPLDFAKAVEKTAPLSKSEVYGDLGFFLADARSNLELAKYNEITRSYHGAPLGLLSDSRDLKIFMESYFGRSLTEQEVKNEFNNLLHYARSPQIKDILKEFKATALDVVKPAKKQLIGVE